MRKPDAETYELGHWESMIIQRALTHYWASIHECSIEGNTIDIPAIKDLANIFAFGTHTVTRKAENDVV